MKSGKIFLLIPVVIVVFLAGCAKQPSVASAGVAIEKFTPQVSTVAGDSPVEFTLIVRNAGEREATDVKAILGGLTFLTTAISEDKEKYWRSETGVDFKDFLKPLDPPNLLSEDAIAGFKGERGIATWHLTAPIQTRDQVYEPTVNLVYSYSTLSTILIKTVNFNYLQSLPENEQKAIDTGIVVSKTTKGPVEVSIKSDQAIISDSSTFPIEIELKNVGGGRIFLGSGQERDPNDLYEIIKLGADRILVELPSDLKCNLPTVGGKYIVRLVEGKTGRILCNKAISGISTTQTLSMEIKVQYRYLIEGKTTVKVSKTLYQPPILDISLEDSTVTIEHNHPTQSTDAVLDLKIKNVGNQEVSGISVGIDYKIDTDEIDTEPVTSLLLTSGRTLRSFETISLPSPVTVRIGNPPDITYTMQTSPRIIEESIDGQTLTEKNDKNNQKSGTIPLDYDIGVSNLKAKVKDPKTFSVEITANLINNGKTVTGTEIPVGIKIADHLTCDPIKLEPLTKELGPLTKKEVTCIYDNPHKLLEFEIEADVPVSELETNKQNNFDDKPNGKDMFEINYALKPSNSKGEVVPYEKLDKPGKKYKLSANVKNIGEVVVNADGREDSRVQFKIIEPGGAEPEKLLCENFIPALDPTKSATVDCETDPLEKEEFEAVAVILGTTRDIAKEVAREKFKVTSAVVSSLKFSIVPGSSSGILSEIGRGVFKYTLTATVQNSEDVSKEFSVRFVDSSGNLLCPEQKLTVDPQGKRQVNCTTDFLAFEKFKAEAVVSDGTFKHSETFAVDSKIKLLALAPSDEDDLSMPIKQDIYPGSLHQSFKFPKNFDLTRVNVNLNTPAVVLPVRLVIGISEDDGHGFPGKLIAVSRMEQKFLQDPFTVINFANFKGQRLAGNKVYWITLCATDPQFINPELIIPQSLPPCNEDSGRTWKYSTSGGTPVDVYSNGFGRLNNLNQLENNADFGFSIYGIEK